MAKSEELITQEVAQKIVKKKDGRDGRNLPTYDHLHGTGENTKLLDFILKKRNLPEISMDDPAQVSDRVEWYFDYCAKNDMRPTVTGLASSIGVTRQTLWNWRTGVNRPSNYRIIERAYDRLEELWEMYMMNGKINPPNGIFLGKNHFGYKDVQDVVVTPNNPLGEARSAEEIAQQYEYLPEE